MRNFLFLETAEIDIWGEFSVEKRDFGHKDPILLKLNSFSGGE